MSENQPSADVVDANPVLDAADDAVGAAYDRMMTNNGSDRGDDGKFVSPNGQEASAGGADEAGAGAPAVTPPAVETPAPAHLPQSIKSLWPAMSEDARKAWSAHVTDTDRKFGEQGKVLGQMKPFHDEFVAAMEQYPEWRGLPPAQLAQGAIRLAAVEREFSKNPVGVIMDLAKRSGSLEKLAQVFNGNAQQGDQGHHVARLERELETLRSQLGKAADPDTIRGEINRTMLAKDAEKLTSDFAAGKEHWAEVEAELPDFIRMVLAKGGERPMSDVLSDAYDMAINANPAVRAKIRAAEAKATAAQTDPKRTEAARKAASMNVKPTANGKDRPGTEEEAMGAAYDRMMSA